MTRWRIVFFLVLSWFVHALPVMAGPAILTPVNVVQPDGTEIEVMIKGDEFQGWQSTADGYTILKDDDSGYWEYAVQDNDGNLSLSGVQVDPAEPAPRYIEQDLRPYLDPERVKNFSDNLTRVYEKRAYAGKIAGTWNPIAISGAKNLLVIRVNFIDRMWSGGITKADVNAIVFDAGQKSVKRFYSENSYGNLTINPVPHTQDAVDGIIDVTIGMNHPYNTLPPSPTTAQQHATEVAWIQAAVSQIETNGWVDLDLYDSNNDGQLSPDEITVYFLVAGYEQSGSAKTPSVWAHAWFMWAPGDVVTDDGKDITDWALNGELNDSDVLHPMGVIAHELGHQLCGFPDLYDTSYTNSGLGLFSAMAGGSWGGAWGEDPGTTPISFDAWSRQYAGWATPQTPSANGQSITFPTALSGANAPLKLVNGLVSTTEYFLAENRYPEKWDIGFQNYFGPAWGGGLLIMHCDITVGSGVLSMGNDINVFNMGSHQGIMAEEATSTSAPSTGGGGHWTTLYYTGNVTSFTDATTPNSKYYDGSASDFGLTAISAPGTSMTATAAIPAWITVTAPNGGESWTSGDSENITWTSGGVGNVKIEYSTNNGSTWNTIVASTAAVAGSYAWTVANAISANCLVRISDAATPALYDQSNAVFNMLGTPEVVVTAPNGGETWAVGFPNNITWTYVNVDNVKIEYSTNNGSTWSTIIASTPASAGSYAWTVPNDASVNCLVRISKATDAALNDSSDAAFTITSTATLTLTAPNGAEDWPVTTTQQITWTSANVYGVKIEYSANNGSSWSTIIASTPASAGSYDWTVPNDVSSNCLVRISKVADNTVTDQSSAAFTISTTPVVAVTSPNGGELLYQSETHAITWTSTNVTSVDIRYSTDSGSSWTNIALAEAAGGGSYGWVIPPMSTSTCLIQISNSDYPSIYDRSDATFSVNATINTLEAKSSSTINSYVYKWNGSQYLPVSIDLATVLQPWEAVWVVVDSDYDLLIPSDRAHHGVGYDAPATLNLVMNPNVWYAVSPPLDPGVGSRNVNTVFNATLGVPETDYRISKWNYSTKTYDHYTNGNDIVGDGGDVLPGRGLWVYHTAAGPQTLTLTGDGVDPLPVETYYKVKLPSNGRFTTHLVGNPFWYPINWNNIKFGTPMTNALPLGKPASTGYDAEPAVVDWDITLGIETQESTLLDTYNRAGIITSAQADPSLLWALDFNPMGDNVRLRITDPYDGERIALAYDYRAAGQSSYAWRIHLSTTLVGIDATLSLGNLASVPEGYGIALIDEQTGVSYTVDSDTEIPVALASAAERTFILEASTTTDADGPHNQMSAEQPVAFKINTVAPNPFNPVTSIDYQLDTAGAVSLSIYNLNGQLVETLVDGEQSAGQHQATWNAAGKSSGIYLVILRQHGMVQSTKITLIK